MTTLLWTGRVLLFLFAVSLLTMPLTQHFWSWDHFLHGGQDFESAASMVLTLLSLVPVLSKQCSRCIDWLFAEWPVLAPHGNRRRPAHSPLPAVLRRPRIEPAAGAPPGSFSIPLLI